VLHGVTHPSPQEDEVKFSRKLVLAGTVILIPLSTLTISGVASAATKTGTGTVTCTSITGKVTLSPPLKTTGPFSQENATLKLKVSGCTGGSPSPVKGGTIKSTLSGAASTNDCTSLGTSSPEASTIKWKGGIAPSTDAFAGYTIVTGGPDNGEGFSLAGGSVTGSYNNGSTKNAKTVAYLNETASQIISGCSTTKGVSKLLVVGGSIST
jgi:hypothetical protein